MTRFFTTLVLLFFFAISYSQFTLSGIVKNERGELLDFASIFLKETEFATSSIQDGSFVLENVPAGRYALKASFIGYTSYEDTITISEDYFLEIVLPGTIYELDQIVINSNQARRESPISYTTMEKEEIEAANIAQDVPYILRWQPSVTVTSDAGAGIGYTGIRVRGSEATRTNVTINGVPLNDAESQTVFWVDLPDFLSNVSEIQLQRGVGVSTQGTSAFGANLNLNTQNIRQNSFAILSGAVGSFNTTKYSAHAGTGLLNNQYSIEGRMSWINSDGYVDRASSDLSSYYFSASKISEGSSLRLNFFSGAEVTYQAWNGLPYQFLETDRTFNPSGTEKSITEPYENEVDNYRQTHAQLIWNKNIGQKSFLNMTGYLTSGRGYFENYKADRLNSKFNLSPDTLVQDIVIQRWLDNLLTGGIFSYEYRGDRLNMIVGGGASQYLGAHFGDVIWRENGGDPEKQKAVNYYSNDGRKREFNVYTRLNYKIGKYIYPFVDVQYRAVNYRYEGPDDNLQILDITEDLQFVNPKFGITVLPNNNHKFFAFYGIANREPSRNEFVNSTPSNRPNAERLYDLELGYNATSKYIDFDLTIYDMQYDDQLVPTGQLGDVGESILTNVDKSYRRGIEIGLLAKASNRVHIGYYGTFSNNRIESFTELVDVWETETQIAIEHTNTNIAYSPSQIHTVTSKFDILSPLRKDKLIAQLNWKYVGEQYLDNTSNAFSLLPSFSYLDALINYNTSFWKVKKMGVTLQVNNILNNKYVSNGWIYRHIPGVFLDPSNPYNRQENGEFFNQTGYFPQATINFLLGVRFEF